MTRPSMRVKWDESPASTRTGTWNSSVDEGRFCLGLFLFFYSSFFPLQQSLYIPQPIFIYPHSSTIKITPPCRALSRTTTNESQLLRTTCSRSCRRYLQSGLSPYLQIPACPSDIHKLWYASIPQLVSAVRGFQSKSNLWGTTCFVRIIPLFPIDIPLKGLALRRRHDMKELCPRRAAQLRMQEVEA